VVRIISHLGRAIIITTLAVPAVQAQETRPHRSPVLGLTLGTHNTSGTTFANPFGLFSDAFVAGSLNANAQGALVTGLGVSGIMGVLGERCPLRRDGSCAPRANFIAVNLLAGYGVPLAEGSVRLLAGPTLYMGEDDRSLGLQARMDAALPDAGRLQFGMMVQGSVIPSYAGERLYAGALGFSLFVR
jgi:hypothetical protein